MTQKEILEKVITKAIANGWNIAKFMGLEGEHTDQQWQIQDNNILMPYVRGGLEVKKLNEYIFNHDFAKALWGKEDIDLATLPEWKNKSLRLANCPAWCWHLQQMVIATDPIKYLGKHI